MKLINYALIKFSLFLVLGIVTAHLFPFTSFSEALRKFSMLPILLGCILILLLLWWRLQNALFPNPYFGLVTYAAFFCLGYSNYDIRLPKLQEEHFMHFVSEENPQLVQLKITELLKPDHYYKKYLADVQRIGEHPTTGKILVLIRKDSLAATRAIDEKLLVSGIIKSIKPPLNPGQFDYAAYMKTQHVHGQIRLLPIEVLHQAPGTKTFRGVAETVREHAIQKLAATAIDTNERAIIQALILGQRRDISKELSAQYAAAGAIHILAVSGLHVGIVFMLLQFLLKPLERLRFGRSIKAFCIVLLLFGFAFIAGLSPSVVRAATMFSLFILATQLNRTTSTVNTLFLSFFGLLLINPMWLFHVGFQLSYLAVFFIIWIQPKLYDYYRPKNLVLRLLWSVTTVTIAAQLGIAPLSIFYFHQFPGLFLITNLVIMPVLAVVLIFGIVVVVLASLDIVPDLLAQLYNAIIAFLNKFIGWVAAQDYFVMEDIAFSGLMVVGSYLLLIATISLWKHWNYHRLIIVLSSICILISVKVYEKTKVNSEALVIFHKSRTSLLAVKNRSNLTILKTDSLKTYKNAFPIKSYRVKQAIQQYKEISLPKAFRYNDKHIIVLDSLGIYPKISAEHSEIIVLLTNSTRVHLERLIDSLQPSLIVADGSNYTSYVKRWRATCKDKKLPFHHTGAKGALILE